VLAMPKPDIRTFGDADMLVVFGQCFVCFVVMRVDMLGKCIEVC
jgi:hypothetical protein